MTSLATLLSVTVFTLSAWSADLPGVRNFHHINDHVYRGAQPTAQGFQSLSALGVKTIIDLREGGGRSASEQKLVEADGMHYIGLPLNGLSAPSDANVAKLLAMFEDRASGPVFIHCRRGADRTGTICACYRIAHDGWTNEKALREARSFGMAWFERAMQRYVLNYHAGTSVAAANAPAAAPALVPAMAVSQ